MVAVVELMYHDSQPFGYIIRMMEHKGALFNMAYFNSQHNIASVFTFITYYMYNLLFILALIPYEKIQVVNPTFWSGSEIFFLHTR